MGDERVVGHMYAHVRKGSGRGLLMAPIGQDGSVESQQPSPEAMITLALEEARAALLTHDVPVGAIVFNAAGEVIGRGRNRREADGDPTAHAEMLAIREAAAALGQWRLEDCTLAVTLEPCSMCAGAMVLARLPFLVFGAFDPKAGAAGSVTNVVQDPRLNHRVELLGGVREQECGDELRAFFRARRRSSAS